ncbi:YicC family protein [Verrucomicrobiaceae bacterium 5K15]|uniref:YicC family protein n=1 Tax=Oceaniferula flava TaxID=2800421 RepID=A0AAE2SC41_9BACT|nr:YicC/YloC family endoribonuclease [Oceaniferula flavus]MBK1855723.1 YicC family protein [Oceaniferula flavus]MBM1137030.1 YicC family protein [Oceaniferula flavus]
MMHSMTGFGRAEHATSTLAARVEASSVNRKQGEIVVQLPRAYAELEAEIRKMALGKLSRGRVNIAIQIEQSDTASDQIRINTKRARALEAAFTELSDAIDRPIQATSADFLRTPEILHFDQESASVEEAREAVIPAVNDALDSMIAMRASEGQHLHDDTEARLSSLEHIAEQISSHAPAVVTHYREQLHRRLSEAGLEIDLNDERLLKEIGLFAERCDISEEITRLHSHFTKFREYLGKDEPVGRPLDFLCQELNREFNTIGSKAHDATLAQLIVNAKTELEKVREQVQNVE